MGKGAIADSSLGMMPVVSYSRSQKLKSFVRESYLYVAGVVVIVSSKKLEGAYI